MTHSSCDTLVKSPTDPAMERLCQQLAQLSDANATIGSWPRASLHACAEAGVFRWFLPREFGGLGWSDEWLVEAYVRLAQACLTTAFIITQRQAACSRILASLNQQLKSVWLTQLAAGSVFSTVAISHLSTSRQHQARPALVAVDVPNGFKLDGYSAWVTGASYADVLVVGASHDDSQVLLAVSPTSNGIEIKPACELTGLSASQTAHVEFRGVEVAEEQLIAGPLADVMRFGGSGTGGLQTSALAIGLSRAALGYLENETGPRPALASATIALYTEWTKLNNDLRSLARGEEMCSREQLRARANSLALRTTQSALTAAKGTGYLLSHPVGRWCREALFFLVWSCPQPVAHSNLCELAGLSSLHLE